jgi:hypothetical protein
MLAPHLTHVVAPGVSSFGATQTIRGGEDASVESIAWYGGRLFAGGLHSTVTEYDLETLMPKASVDSFGGPVWAIAVNNAGTMLAVSVAIHYPDEAPPQKKNEHNTAAVVTLRFTLRFARLLYVASHSLLYVGLCFDNVVLCIGGLRGWLCKIV